MIEITAQPHTGCKKFVERFGVDALKFLSSPANKRLRLRGIYARVAQSGRIRVGDLITAADRQRTGRLGAAVYDVEDPPVHC